jgi:two-component system, response regulator PdtaR
VSARIKILVVDDDPLVLRLTRWRLESAGYEVVLRSEALGTAKAIRQHRPDLVLLDVDMPGLTGDALARLLRQTPNLPEHSIAFHSSAEPDVLERMCEESGAIGWVRKTPDSAELLARIGFLLLKKANAGRRARTTSSGGRATLSSNADEMAWFKR